MTASLRRLISNSARFLHHRRSFSASADAEQIRLLSSWLGSGGQVSETIMTLLQWRNRKIAISDAVYRHVLFASVHIDRPTLEALCSFLATPDREAALLLQLVNSSRISPELLSSSSQWSSSLLCKAIEIVAERRDAVAMGVLQSALSSRADFDAIRRAAPHIIHSRLSTNTHSHIPPLLDLIRAYEIRLESSSFDGVFNIDRSGSPLADVFEIYEDSVRSSLSPNSKIFSDLLHTIIRSSAHQRVAQRLTRRLLKQIRESQTVVDAGLMLKACARAALPAEGLRLICDLGVDFHPQYAISLVKACANIHVRKSALFHLQAVETAMMHFKVRFASDDYRALLRIYAGFGRDRAETTLALSQQLPELNAKDITARLRTCHTNIEEALMLLPRGRDFGELRPTTSHFRFALLTMAKTRSHDLALRLLDLFNDMRNRCLFLVPPDGPTLTAIYTLVLRSADNLDFEQFLERFLCKDKISPDCVTLIAVYEYCAGKDIDHWHQTKHLIDGLKGRVGVDGAVCSFAVRLLLRIGLLEEAVNLVAESKRHRSDRNRVHPATYRTLLKALVQAGDGGRAQQVLDMQQNDGLKIRPSHLQHVRSITMS